MSKVDLIKLAKSLKRKFNRNSASYVSYCRRIERVRTDKRICAMTFDDGPTYDADITATLVDILDSFGAKGTFDVIGTTEHNYPDIEGKIGTPAWGGVRYDHYPRFNKDKIGGSKNCPELIQKILLSGHEITNHTYSHVLFGKKNVIYSKRHTLQGFDEVYNDVMSLHNLLSDKHGYSMRFSRPPHYVDKIIGGFTSYDVYAKIGYNYLAASFDGAGWLPCETEEDEISAMVEPIRTTLERDPDALCGQIIFQKDGYNMALRAPVKEGLMHQLKLLNQYGYKVVTVSELMAESPFKDVGREDDDFDYFNMLQRTKPIVFSDNTLRLDQPMTKGELAMLIAPRDVSVDKRIEYIKRNKPLPYSVKATHPYSAAMIWAKDNGHLDSFSGNVSETDFEKCSDFFKYVPNKLTRREIYKAFKHN